MTLWPRADLRAADLNLYVEHLDPQSLREAEVRMDGEQASWWSKPRRDVDFVWLAKRRRER